MTNIEKIKKMTVFELCLFLSKYSCSNCPIKDCDGRMEVGRYNCRLKWLKWLEEEAVELETI